VYKINFTESKFEEVVSKQFEVYPTRTKTRVVLSSQYFLFTLNE